MFFFFFFVIFANTFLPGQSFPAFPAREVLGSSGPVASGVVLGIVLRIFFLQFQASLPLRVIPFVFELMLNPPAPPLPSPPPLFPLYPLNYCRTSSLFEAAPRLVRGGGKSAGGVEIPP